MKTPVVRAFVYSAALLLLMTGTAKVISACGGARILQTPDPLLGISFRMLFWIAGSIEAVVALICFVSKQIGRQAGAVAWLATDFLAYRMGLWWVGWHRPCPCLGNLTDALHIPPGTADVDMKIVLAYLLIGSYGSLFWLWRQRRNASLATRSVDAETSGA